MNVEFTLNELNDDFQATRYLGIYAEKGSNLRQLKQVMNALLKEFWRGIKTTNDFDQLFDGIGGLRELSPYYLSELPQDGNNLVLDTYDMIVLYAKEVV